MYVHEELILQYKRPGLYSHIYVYVYDSIANL